MNRFQANICLLCVTAIWSAEVIILSCLPDSILPFAVSSITNLIGAALLFMCFFRRNSDSCRSRRRKSREISPPDHVPVARVFVALLHIKMWYDYTYRRKMLLLWQ